MTFQIGIVGFDGVLLASDQKYVNESWQGWKSQKITIDDNRKIAFCTAGTDLPSYIARDAYGLNDPLKFLLTESRETVMRYLKTEPFHGHHGSILWVACTDGTVDLWTLDIKGHDYQSEMPQRVRDKRCIGHPSLADWIVEAYWPGRPEETPIADLQLFAAHAVLMSAKMNSRIVGGLEMAMCRPDKFEWVPESEIALLKSRSTELDSDFSARLFS